VLCDLLWLQDFRGLTRQSSLTGKVQRWKLYLQDKDIYLCHVPGEEVHQFVPDALSRLCANHMLSNKSEKPAHKRHQALLTFIEQKHRIPDAVFKQIVWPLGSAEMQRVP